MDTQKVGAAPAAASPGGLKRPAGEQPARAAGHGRVEAAALPLTLVILLADFGGVDRWWGWGRFLLGTRAARRAAADLCFVRQMGSGHRGGFGLRPDLGLQALCCGFRSPAAALAFAQGNPLVEAYRRHARELALLTLQPWQAKGRWGGVAVAPQGEAPAEGPIAALTRASIRPRAALDFWRHAPAAQAGLAQAEGCLMAVGLGEAPLLRQATVSLWRSVADMDGYARRGGHQAAIQAARAGQHFSESMFLRLRPLALDGIWQGRPLRLDGTARHAG